jgi:hypothetical protein
MHWYWTDSAGGRVAHLLPNAPQRDWENWREARLEPQNVALCGHRPRNPWVKHKAVVRMCFSCLEATRPHE